MCERHGQPHRQSGSSRLQGAGGGRRGAEERMGGGEWRMGPVWMVLDGRAGQNRLESGVGARADLDPQGDGVHGGESGKNIKIFSFQC